MTGFEDESRVGISLPLLRRKSLFNRANAFPVALPVFPRVGAFRPGAVERTAVAKRRHHLVGFEEQAGISLVEQINVAERDRAHGIAVIRAFE